MKFLVFVLTAFASTLLAQERTRSNLEPLTDEELNQKYTLLETFIFPKARGFLVAVNENYEFPMPAAGLLSAQSKYHQEQTDIAIANVETLVASVEYELLDRALVMVGDFSGDGMPDVMIQRNVPADDGAKDSAGNPVLQPVWFVNVPLTEIAYGRMRNLSDSVADPAYSGVQGFKSHPDFANSPD
ncbi:MAG: hypothetical protein AAF358_24885 [Pseudomonadota bacterium]